MAFSTFGEGKNKNIRIFDGCKEKIIKNHSATNRL